MESHEKPLTGLNLKLNIFLGSLTINLPNILSGKMSAYYICCIYSSAPLTRFHYRSKPNQTALKGVV